MTLFVRLALLLITVMAIQYGIFLAFEGHDPVLGQIDSALRQPGIVIQMSDSVASNVSSHDEDRRTVADMVASTTGARVALVWHSSLSLQVFDALTTYIVRHENQPRVLIVPVNLRTFSPINERYPGQLFERLTFAATSRLPFAEVLAQPLAVLKWLDLSTVTPDQWLSTPVYDWDRQLGTVKDCYSLPGEAELSRESVATAYRCDNMTRIIDADINYRALMHLLETTGGARIPTLIVVMPVDTEEATALTDPSFARHVRENAAFICDAVIAKGAECLDLASAVPHRHFDAHVYPTVHLDSAGRMTVAQRLSGAITPMISEAASAAPAHQR